jgi:hypothetical protein
MHTTKLLVGGCAALLLCACGGGAGDNASVSAIDSTPSSSRVQSYLQALLVTSAPLATYPPNTPEALAYRTINTARLQCGFGALTQQTALDAATQGHANWMLIHQQFNHLQDAINQAQAFTGTDVYARIDASGAYAQPYYATEVFTVDQMSNAQEDTSIGIHRLLNAPYHAYSLLNGYRDIGLAVRNASDVGLSQINTRIVIANLALPFSQTPQTIAPNEVVTYPCEGTRQVAYQLTHEQPNPIPSRDLGKNPLGVNIFIKVREGQRLELNSYTITHQITRKLVLARDPVGGINGQPDPHGLFGASSAYLSTEYPLQPNTLYDVVIEGKNEGYPFSKAFSFETGDSF